MVRKTIATYRSFIAGCTLAAMTLPTHAANQITTETSATYEGTIYADSGLGLNGQTMTVAFSYDTSVAATYTYPGIGTSEFSNPLTSMQITIGANRWSWITYADSFINLTDDGVIIYAAGVEDRWSLGAYGFTGPSLTGGFEQGHALEMYFYDNMPTGTPDALEAYEMLPATAPDPALFTSYYDSVMQFSFYTGDPEVGTYYFIEANNIQQVAAVPEPTSYALWLAGLTLLGSIAHRRHS